MNAPWAARASGTLAVAMALGAASAAFAQELYLMESGDTPILYRIDGPTGELLDQKPNSGATSLGRGLAMRWDGMLFAIDHIGNDDYRMFRFSAATGEGHFVGGPMAIGEPSTLAADPNTGRLYATNWASELYQIDHKTGEAVLIGVVDAPEMWPMPMAMGIGRDGVGYVTDWGNVGLYRMDLATAKTELVCYLGSQQWFNDMAFDSDNEMWGVFQWEGAIRRHDVATCKGSVLYNGWEVQGIEVVPEGDGCYSDCNLDGVLDLFDFLCFVNAFNAGDGKADCTGDQDLSLFDFLCFVNSFNAGC